MNILLLTSHSIAEYDDLRMLSDLGYDVFSIGAYTDPAHPGDEMRPALPNVRAHPELAALCEVQREKHAGEPTETAQLSHDAYDVIDWAKGDLHPDLIDWADTIIVHHFPRAWIGGQWDRIRHKRVIWRTCGQSNPLIEEQMRDLRAQGLEIVRYSPKERIAYGRLGVYAGEDALIRFGKYPDDWQGWTGDDPVVGNVTQDMAGRGEFCGLYFWLDATRGLPAKPAGPNSERLSGGVGALSYDEMRAYLRSIRAYLYTGTQPASYTLGLIEAMMTGVPVVSIGPEQMWLPDLFEGEEIVGGLFERVGTRIDRLGGASAGEPHTARVYLRYLLEDDGLAREASLWMRATAIDLFGMDTIGPQWRAFLGYPGRSVFSTEQESVTA